MAPLPLCRQTRTHLACLLCQDPPATRTVALRRTLFVIRGVPLGATHNLQCPRTTLLLVVLTLGLWRHTGQLRIPRIFGPSLTIRWLAPQYYFCGVVEHSLVCKCADRYMCRTVPGRSVLILGTQSVRKIGAIIDPIRILIHTPTGEFRSESG